MTSIKIKSALISVFSKENLAPIIKLLHEKGVALYSTGGTQKFIEEQGVPVIAVEDVTGYPSILGGRVKTLHPKVFGGILYRRELEEDQSQVETYDIPSLDLVIVDLYPFENTVASGGTDEEIIEKIDIGGISLIRAAAKNYKDVLIIPSMEQYNSLEWILREKDGITTLVDRKLFAANAFDVSSHYDTAIFNYFNKEEEIKSLKVSERISRILRYGENPHQEGVYYGKLDEILKQMNGKELSYNNLVDIDAAISLIEEFDDERSQSIGAAFAIIKHTNACGVALGSSVKEAYLKAFEADTISAFGGVLVTNKEVDKEAAEELNKLFFEVIIAPDYTEEALNILKAKKNRIILHQKGKLTAKKQFKNLLNGYIVQDRDLKTDSLEDFEIVTKKHPSDDEMLGMIFASKIAKHTKSNTIVLARENQMYSSGVGQTSRVDALNQAIEKANKFGFNLHGTVMASDAFFPFPDCVEIASNAGIKAVIQPGGSVKDKDSIDCCNRTSISMVFTGIRHFKH
ncbi:MAG: bifunctional phosphoribosylaminoimidazolecarboxamide formyltransferase/IMP cyclohydrolase [Bacteroidota bacterium]|nr:bifunctional phosphoribosylaminoimidazolecarboxamide formyltransferase/IMP cyclohydrolase [Bacteroidota bacterium]